MRSTTALALLVAAGCRDGVPGPGPGPGPFPGPDAGNPHIPPLVDANPPVDADAPPDAPVVVQLDASP